MAIITPTDTITITIDNTKNPASADMRFSRDLPAPYAVAILAGLIKSLMEDQMRRMQAPLPFPPAVPPSPPAS